MTPFNLVPSILSRFLTLHLCLCTLVLCIATQSVAQSAATQHKEADTKGNNGAIPAASEVSPEACVKAHQESQTLRRQYRLLESRDRLLLCSNTDCPGLVRKDCLRWLDEVAVQISSVVVHVDSGDSNAPHNVKVYIDNDLRFESIPNRAIELDPGTYHFRFEVEGRQPVDLQVTVAEAEKFKNVTVNYSPPAKSSNGIAISKDDSARNPISVKFVSPSKTTTRPVPAVTYLFAGLGGAAAVNFGIWALSTQSLKHDLEQKCSPNCDQKYIDRVRTRALVADISLGVSVASFATAAITYFARPEAKPLLDVAVGPLPNGGFIGQVGARF